jgi:hypothetical protein
MKNLSSKCAAIFFFASSSSAYPANWVFIGKTSGGDKYYIETGSIKADNKFAK